MWRNYLVIALRTLGRDRVYAIMSIATLALGFTVALLVAIFTTQEFSYDRFLPNFQRTYLVVQTVTPPSGGQATRSYAIRTDVGKMLAADFPQVEAEARITPSDTAVEHAGVLTDEPNIAWADPNIFNLLQVHPLAGDLKTALATPDGLVITRSLARKYFGGDTPIGSTLTLRTIALREDQPGPPMPFRITAVIDDLPNNSNLQVQGFASGLRVGEPKTVSPFGSIALTYVRLRPHADVSEVNAGLAEFVKRRIAPGPLMGFKIAYHLVPLSRVHLPDRKITFLGRLRPTGNRTVLDAVTAIAGLVLLAAAVNFVGLATARATARSVEVGVRKAAGATRNQLMQQFVAEALLQALVALIIGLSLAEIAAPSLGSLIGRSLQADYLHRPGLLIVSLAFSLVIAISAGLYPAAIMSGFKPAAALRGGRTVSGSEWVRQSLVMVQFLILTGLMLASVTLFRQTSLALNQAERFGGKQVLWISEPSFCSRANLDRVRALQGVDAATCSTQMALQNSGSETSAARPDGTQISVEIAPVDLGFFQFYGLHPLAGRLFQAQRGMDTAMLNPGATADPSVIVNESAVRALGFSSPADAVGKPLRWDRLYWAPPQPGQYLKGRTSEIVGVIPNFSPGVSREPVRPTVYWIDPIFDYVMSVRVRGTETPEVLASIDRIWRTSGHVRPMKRQFVDQAIQVAYSDLFALRTIVTGCLALALVIGCIGLFSLAAFTTERRTKEIGIRKALGATVGDVVRLLTWQFAKPLTLAVVVATPLTFWIMGQWLQTFPHRVTFLSWSYLVVILGIFGIGLATVLSHTVKAARARPVSSLRYE